jgi:hypothetical protein
MEATEILKKIATPGDAAAAGIGFVLGLPIDYVLLHSAIPVGTISGYSAVAAWSLKKAIQGMYGEWRHSRTSAASLRKRADRLKDFLESHTDPDESAQLATYRSLWESKLMTDEEFGLSLQKLVHPYTQ